MFKQHFSWLVSALWLIGATSPAVADAEGARAEAPMPAAVAEQASRNQTLAHKMMGHINLARLALDLNLPSEAKRQIERARSLQEKLAAQMPEFRLDSSFEYGKVTYDDKANVKEHYIPVIDDVFLVSDYAEIFKRADVVDLDELSAGVMRVGVSVDLREVKSALDRSTAAIESEDYGIARIALNDVFRNAIVDEEEIDDPALLIAENLALAKSFVDTGQYDSARLTLKHVQDRLQQAGKDKLAGIDNVAIDDFSAELDDMRAELRKKDPTLSQRVSARLAGWEETISGWFS